MYKEYAPRPKEKPLQIVQDSVHQRLHLIFLPAGGYCKAWTLQPCLKRAPTLSTLPSSAFQVCLCEGKSLGDIGTRDSDKVRIVSATFSALQRRDLSDLWSLGYFTSVVTACWPSLPVFALEVRREPLTSRCVLGFGPEKSEGPELHRMYAKRVYIYICIFCVCVCIYGYLWYAVLSFACHSCPCDNNGVSRTEVASFGREAVTDYRVVERFAGQGRSLSLLGCFHSHGGTPKSSDRMVFSTATINL